MQDLKVTLIQSEIHWQNAGANLAMFEEKIWLIEGKTDLIVLPEMFNTGFTMNAEQVAEPMNFTTFKWMKQMAAQTGAVITGSVVIKEGNNYYNRLIWMQPDGGYDCYDKRHLFRMANEHEHFSGGEKRIVKELKGWKICPLVCYDLRFPVWSRNTSKNNELDYDLLLFVANWPAVRVNAWDILLKSRAVENVSYCLGLNRVGKDENDIDYNGHSAVYGPKGETLYFSEDNESISTVILSKQDLDQFREKFPAHLDADEFDIKS
ncbi:amidohydrolase [Fulvivirga lutimaris]|uniref:amidohydrolase n=1 Tax=Fulvivirga lutimaris TaxID=1819566 RepID=UPI0012BD5D50|nr:amidohydrolase [Fulvivirga lutimaris]MTI41745.1 amidohydrolase [Fulvivirga lutimaris]